MVARERVAYALFALVCTLWVGGQFFATLKWQTFMAQARLGQAGTGTLWSAPLDDVFIHFDFARSTARGFPFQWSEGNGYSSGGTSLVYPLILSLGYRIGYDGLDLMLWAGICACLCVFGCLLGARRLFGELPRALTWLLPPLLLSVGALAWSLFSGMEVALFLCVWTLCLITWDDLLRNPSRWRAGRLGAAGALLVACRPESVLVVAALCLTATYWTWSTSRWRARFELLMLGAIPGALVIFGQALANRYFTGEWGAAGALVKLELNHPFMSGTEVWEAWKFFLGYQIYRVTDYHFSELRFVAFGVPLSLGWVVWILGALPFAFHQTRRQAVLLWACMLGWLAIVSLNGQVRWQNERYTMPVVAWLLMAAALGLGVVLYHFGRALQAAWQRPKQRATAVRWSLLTALSLGAALSFAVFQETRFREQLWFFGRASRNIYEQHVRAGEYLTRLPVKRVMLGDAGAIPYVSDLPALDFIGLGGYHQLPFARATRLSIGAGLELIQRLPENERPNVLLLYPTWWGDLPLWFGNKLEEFPVRGNVICGGLNKLLYLADWTALDNSTTPFSPDPAWAITAELDPGDLLSERAAGFQLSAPGYIEMKLLPHPKRPHEDAWDSGRIVPRGARASFTLTGLRPHKAARLLLRLAPTVDVELRITAGNLTTETRVSAADGWVELTVELPSSYVGEAMPVSIEPTAGDFVFFHLWGLQER